MSNNKLSSAELYRLLDRDIGSTSLSIAAVCFDFFDTLVHRSVLPEHTKKLAAERLIGNIDIGLNVEEIYQLRTILESQLCRRNRTAGYDPEFSLPELALLLYEKVKLTSRLKGISGKNEFIKHFIDTELAVEKAVQLRNEEVVDSLKLCCTKGVTTAVVSDFYLPEPYFNKLLDHHGLTGLIDRVFISANHLQTKGHSGRLYKIVAESIGCSPDQLIMIGDNPIADVTQAQLQGLTAYQLSKPASPSLEKKAAYEEYEEALKTHKAPFFKEMGLSLHLFIQRLFLTASAGNSRDLLFCSKEGEFLRKLFIRYQDLKFGRQVIRSHYFYVSRKATFICSLKPLEQETFDRLFAHYRDLSLSEFLQSLNFSKVQAGTICKELQLDFTTRHDGLKNHADFIQLVKAPLFRDHYELLRQEQRGNFLSYLSHIEVDFQKDGLNLVDVGWKGSIQNNIYYALSEQVAVNGYYLGLLNPTEIRKKNQKTGILFHDVPVHSDYIHVFNNNRSLFEILLAASHGSADGYYFGEQFSLKARDGNVSLYSVCDNPQIPQVALVDLPEERSLYKLQIQPLQRIYEQLHEELSTLSSISDIASPDLEWFAMKHARMVFVPKGEEVDLFSKLYHLENFGLFEFTAFDNPDRISFFQKIKNLWALKKDPEAILETGTWPPIILKQLGLAFLTHFEGKKRFNRIFGSSR